MDPYKFCMANLIKNKDDRTFVRIISRMVYCNPFTSERLRLEAEALGDSYDEAGRDWNLDPRSERRFVNMEHIVGRIQTIIEANLGRFHDGKGDKPDRDCFTALGVFLLYHQCRTSFDRLIEQTHRNGPSQRRISFYPSFLEAFRHYFEEEQPISPEHLFACCFQLRRAYHHIFHFFAGKSAAATEIRCQLWQSIFTHDLHRYQRSLYRQMEKIPTLITGPSGTGKEVLARAIAFSRYIPFDGRDMVFKSDFTSGFFPINLSSLSPTLIESELFGHRKGAFTGALQDRDGFFSACGPEGTVFLDEIGDTDPEIQVKLLRVLQTRQFQRLGDVDSSSFVGKIVAATNQDMERLIPEGKFREDFYFRLRSDVIETRSLAAMLKGDREELHFLAEYAAVQIAGEEEAAGLTEDFMRWSDEHPGHSWPGNFRELEQAIRSIMVHGVYNPPKLSRGSATRGLEEQLAGTRWTLKEMTERYVQALHRETPVLEELARRLQVDRRTVKRYLGK